MAKPRGVDAKLNRMRILRREPAADGMSPSYAMPLAVRRIGR